MFVSPGEIAVKIGIITIHWYGIIICLSVLSGIYIVKKLSDKFDISQDTAYDISFYALVSSVIGARFYFVLLNLPYYLNFPNEIFMIWQGGISIHGAILAGALTLFAYSKIHSVNFFKLTDLFVPALALGQSIGRWGNFFNSEAFGLPTNLPWKLYIPLDKRPEHFINYEFFHPTFLYESIWNFLVFLILIYLVRIKLKLNIGVITFVYILLYSIGRSFIELLRVDSVLNFYGLPFAFIVSSILIVIAVIGLLFVKNKNEKYLQ